MSAAEGKKTGKAAGKKAGGEGGRKKASTVGADALENDRGTIQKRRGLFSKDLRPMMYGYGDSDQPLPETVDLVEDIVVDYVTTMMHKAMDESSKRGKLTTEDLVYLVRKDPRKYGRVKELLFMNEEIKKAKRAFEQDDELLPGEGAAAATAANDS